MYHDGQGVPQDYAEAVRWYRKATEQNYAAAQFNLGGMYYDGLGVPKDYVQAYKWFNLAATRDEGAREACNTLAKLMTSEQIAEAEKLSRELD